jgi:hypothetical protein
MTNLSPLELTIEGAAADGSSRRNYAGDAVSPLDRPTGIQFKTSRFNGFTDGSFVLPRRSDLDQPDLQLLNEFVFTGQDGFKAYEGRCRDLPRDLGDQGHTVTVALAGWISHMQDRRFSMIFVDRSLEPWNPPAAPRQQALDAANVSHQTGPTVMPNVSGGVAGLRLEIQGQWESPYTPRSEAWYDAGDHVEVESVYYDFTGVSNTSFVLIAFAADDDEAVSAEASVDLYTASTGTGTYTPATARRYVGWQWYYNATPAGAEGAVLPVDIRRLAVFGDHGLTKRGTAPDQGYYASDILGWVVDNYCPKLNTTGVRATSRALSNVVFRDRTFPYDVLGVVNRQHLYNFGVWDDRTLHFEPPPDMSDFDWQVRADDPGVRLRIQGDSTEHLVSGLEVEFTNTTTGVREVLLPEDHEELRDDSVKNPYVRAGYPGEDTISISDACNTDEALEVGRVALAQRNQPRGVGEIDCSHHIRNRAGQWRPVYEVRADQRVAVVSSDNERPRLIGETSYNHDDRSLTIAVDSTLRTPDAILDTLR